MIDNADPRTKDLRSYAIEPRFYMGTVRNVPANTYAYVYIDGTDNEYVYCKKSPNLSLSANKRVIVMEIGGTYMVLQNFT